jgi:hypothetical protein
VHRVKCKPETIRAENGFAFPPEVHRVKCISIFADKIGLPEAVDFGYVR